MRGLGWRKKPLCQFLHLVSAEELGEVHKESYLIYMILALKAEQEREREREREREENQ